jgi:hypothetical protein
MSEFIYATVPACKLTEDRVAKLLQLADEIPFPDGTSNEEMTDWRKIAKTTVNELVEIVNGPSEEYSEFRIDGMNFILLITGGMSWGESPTDCCEQFTQLGDFPTITNQMLEWAKADFAASPG